MIPVMQHPDITLDRIDEVMSGAEAAFGIFRRTSLRQREALLRAVAAGLEAARGSLVAIAHQESRLPLDRLHVELTRTIFQLTSYGEAVTRGNWLDARIDRSKGKPDVRKTRIPLGPVIVFGASNFPFAYSTAGGDTACALGAGCPVIVKAHPAHAGTSQLVADQIHRAVQHAELPAAVFQHVHGQATAVGEALVRHSQARAVGFTGSFAGGKQLFDWAAARKVPIPVFAEMSSINPVLLLPGRLQEDTAGLAGMLAGSITLNSGQFCTNPGLLIARKSPHLDPFLKDLARQIQQTVPKHMLHEGIYQNYEAKRREALGQPGVTTIAVSGITADAGQGLPTLASITASAFLANPLLHQEVFGPFSLLVVCDSDAELLDVAHSLGGQLTTSIMASAGDLLNYSMLIETLEYNCGRLIFNGVPTGVEVCLAMQHGGPFPATTDSRFTSVGADGLSRFARPVAYQNCPDSRLPDELKDANPLKIWRTVSNELTRDALEPLT